MVRKERVLVRTGRFSDGFGKGKEVLEPPKTTPHKNNLKFFRVLLNDFGALGSRVVPSAPGAQGGTPGQNNLKLFRVLLNDFVFLGPFSSRCAGVAPGQNHFKLYRELH